MKKVFVTGGNGFLGRKLCKFLTSIGYEVTAPSSQECDLREVQSLEKFSINKYDEIYHLAAWTQAGDFCLTHSGEQWIINQKVNTNIINWWYSHQFNAKFIFMGTSCSYDPKLKLIEDFYMQGEPIDSLYTYAMTKRMLLQGAKSMEKQYKMNWLCLVPSTLYGPDYHNDARQMHFIFDLVKKILRGKYFNDDVELWGNGEQRRELVYIDDFINALNITNKKCVNQVVNIGSGDDFSIREFAMKICDIVDYDHSKIRYDHSKYVGAKSKKLEISKLLNIYPDYKDNLTPLKKGLEQVINWFEKTEAYK